MRVFIDTNVYNEAEIAKFSAEELREYESNRKAYRDLKNSLDTAQRDGYKKGHEEGREVGRLDEKKETIKRLLESNSPIELIAIAAGITKEEVKKIIDKID